MYFVEDISDLPVHCFLPAKAGVYMDVQVEAWEIVEETDEQSNTELRAQLLQHFLNTN